MIDGNTISVDPGYLDEAEYWGQYDGYGIEPRRLVVTHKENVTTHTRRRARELRPD